MNTLLIIGANSRIALSCARIWISDQSQNYEKIILVGRNKDNLSITAKDLKTRCPYKTIIIEVSSDLSDIDSIIQLSSKIKDYEGTITTALIAHGQLINNKKCRDDYHNVVNGINVNCLSVAILLEAIITKVNNEQNHRKISVGVIGSVAGDRGRASNYIYGATKSFIETYVEGIQHMLALSKSNVTVTLIKPGPTRTTMTATLDNSKFATPDEVAKDIVKGIKRGKRIIYSPNKWKLIMTVIKYLPLFIFNRINI